MHYKFAKGRIDSMLGHLLKRCPNMTQDDRNIAFLHMQNNSSGPAKAKKQASNQAASHGDNTQTVSQVQSQMPPSVDHMLGQHTLPSIPREESRQAASQQIQQMQRFQQHVQHATPPNLPFHMLLQRQQSALDTLAEVSRRHLDYSVQKDGYPTESQDASMLQQTDRALVEQALLAALQRQNSSGNNAITLDDESSLPLYSNPDGQAQAQVGVQPLAFGESQAPFPLVQTATAANQQLEQSDHHQGNATIDPQLDDPIQSHVETPLITDRESPPQPPANFMTWSENPQDFVTQQELPSNDPSPEFGLLQKTDKANARARFTDTRRKQVQEIRKRGACMRCRMLKKPCSEGTPCGTCKKIDSARLWKGTCLRTKLAEEFTLYSTSYFHSRAVARISTAVKAMTYAPMPGRMEIKLFAHSTVAMTFSCRRYFIASAPASDHDQTQASDDLITLEDSMASQKVSDYCNRDAIIDELISIETNALLQTTLREAKALLESEKSQEATSNPKRDTRTNHISPGVLLKNVVELWAETSCLVSSQQKALMLRYNPNMLSSQDSQPVVWPESAGESSHTTTLDTSNHNIVIMQLLTALETTCHRLSKAVMNELERRLLQRQQVSGFATFISAVILLNCVERITAFYHSLDPLSDLNDNPPEMPVNATSSPDSNLRRSSYPLSIPAPSVLWPQGPHFARLLITLLRMRALPPPTTRTIDNKLAVLQEPRHPVRLNGVAVRDQQDENTTKAARWLDPLNLDVDDLRARRDGMIAEAGWEMRFVSEVLLGEGM